MIALGLSVGFKANVWNIGAEGQYIMGAIFGASFALSLYPLESIFIFPVMILVGILGGSLWSMIPALLKVKFNVNEILVSLMLVYVAEQILALASLGLICSLAGIFAVKVFSNKSADVALRFGTMPGSGYAKTSPPCLVAAPCCSWSWWRC